MSEEKRRWQFSIRDVLLIMLIVGLAVGWLVDHYRLADELQRQRNHANYVWLGNSVPANNSWQRALTLFNGTPSVSYPAEVAATVNESSSNAPAEETPAP